MKYDPRLYDMTNLKKKNAFKSKEGSESAKLPCSPTDKLEEIKGALQGYYDDLNNREHGGVACGRFLHRVETVLEMRWEQK